MIKLMNGNCLELMKTIEDQSIDMVLADPPYGTTVCKWDSVIPLELMWEQLKRIIKPNGAIVMTASQPFTTTLISSNMQMFKYCWVWEKDNATNFMQAKVMPLKYHEDIVVFSIGKNPKYNPVKWDAGKIANQGGSASKVKKSGVFNKLKEDKNYKNTSNLRYPKSIIKYNRCKANDGVNGCLHPTQKPVALMDYLIKTYTNEHEMVLDFTMGSGTTGVACKNLNRKFIGIELDVTYFEVASKRINEEGRQASFL